ncbi:MAG: hypothetical protein H7123_02840 [Thermoleophilia bacterium]|nr:hypothetical protein [Thermoleophilia bacterium]
MLIISVACLTIGSLALLVRNAGIAVGIALVFMLVIENLIPVIPKAGKYWEYVSLTQALQHIVTSDHNNLVVDGIVVTLGWIAVLGVASFLVEQRRDL